MRGLIPNRPTGTGKDAVFNQAVWDKLWGTESRVANSSTVKVKRTSRGMTFHAAVSAATTGIKLFVGRLQKVYPDYLQCFAYNEFTGHTDTAPINVAKQFLHRNSELYLGNPSSGGPRIIMGVSHNYTYADNIDANGINNVTRTDSFGSTEAQIIVPPWVIEDIIYAIECPEIIIDPVAMPNLTTTWVHIGDSRQWAGPTS